MLIYLIDDDEEEYELFEMALNETNLNTELKYFNNAIIALEYLKKTSEIPMYIFLDLNMPRMNGKECLRVITQDNALKDLKIIIYSTSSHEKDVHEVQSLGAFLYVVKPASFTTLVSSLKSILESDEFAMTHHLESFCIR